VLDQRLYRDRAAKPREALSPASKAAYHLDPANSGHVGGVVRREPWEERGGGHMSLTCAYTSRGSFPAESSAGGADEELAHRPRRQGPARSQLEVGGAVLRTAVTLIVTRPGSSGLLNFTAHSPIRQPMLQKMPFCAPPADRTEGIVSVQNDGGSARGYHELRTSLAVQRSRGYSPADSRPGCILFIAAYVENLLFCRRPGRTPTAAAP
jgi:hypothetical protein